MKLDKVILDENMQTDEALKHIYTVLISNKEISVIINFPTLKKLPQEKEGDSSEGSDVELNLKSIVPIHELSDIPERSHAESVLLNNRDDNDSKQDEGLSPATILADEESPKVKHRQMNKYVKLLCCKVCKETCFRDKRRPMKSLTEIFFGSFLDARKEIRSFKTSWEFITVTEQQTSKKVFYMLMLCMTFFFLINVILPIAASFLGTPVCSPAGPLYIYMAYFGYIILTTCMEVGIII